MAPRLQRLEQTFERHPVYFVTACTANRDRILATTEVHQGFLTFAHGGSDHGAYVGAYVMMPDHLHLFLRLDDERATVSTWMKSLKNSLSKRLCKCGIPAPHWQKGFFDHVVRGSESYRQKWEYVRDNPVRAGLTSSWEQWPYLGEIHDLEFRSDRV